MSVSLKLSKNHDGLGKDHYYEGPCNVDDEKLDETNSYILSNGYAVFYSHSQYRGIPGVFTSSSNSHLSDDYYYSVPTSITNNKELHKHEWKDSVNSIVLTNDLPINPWLIIKYLLEKFKDYPGVTYGKDNDKASQFFQWYFFNFKSQNCSYRFYYPKIFLDTETNLMNFQFWAAHVTGGRNDTAKISFTADLNGNLVGDVKASYSCYPGTVPDWVINLTDEIIKVGTPVIKAIVDLYVDIIIDVATDGVGIVADEEVDYVINKAIDIIAKLLTAFVDHINDILNTIAKIKTGNGGLLYFPYVITHGINNVLREYLWLARGSNQENIPNAKTLSLNKVDIPNAAYFPASKWSGESCSFYMDNLDSSTYSFWKPDFSQVYNGGGAICSFKLDGEDKNHLAVFMLFDPTGKLISLQSSAYVHDCIDKDDYEVPNSGLITYDKTEKIYQFLHKNQSTSSSEADQDTLLEAYTFYTERAIRKSVENVGEELTENLQNMAAASTYVIRAIVDNLVKE